MAPRSRTGCLTCRQRKLKCSEERPVCAQCVKANRECIPNSGLTFRHQQNPSMTGNEFGEDRLKNFYGYTERFGQGATWVAIPSELTFIHTSNPYEDDAEAANANASMLNAETSIGDNARAAGLAALAENATRYGEDARAHDFDFGQTTYPAYATQGLEALSAVASGDHRYYAPVPPMDQGEQETDHPATMPAEQQGNSSTAQQLENWLNPSAGVNEADSQIDPRLQSDTLASASVPPDDQAAMQTSQPQPQPQESAHVYTSSRAALSESLADIEKDLESTDQSKTITS